MDTDHVSGRRQVAAQVFSGKGKHGFDDKHRGQLMVVTGPTLATRSELATAASQALGMELQFEYISEAEAQDGEWTSTLQRA